jgi:hypothetical protein
LKTLLLPIAVDFLPQRVECFARFGNDPRMDFPVNGFIAPVRGKPDRKRLAERG